MTTTRTPQAPTQVKQLFHALQTKTQTQQQLEDIQNETETRLFDTFYTCAREKDDQSMQQLFNAGYSVFKRQQKGTNHTILSLLAASGETDSLEWLMTMHDKYFKSASAMDTIVPYLGKYDAQALLEHDYPYTQIAAGFTMGGHFQNKYDILEKLCAIQSDYFRYQIVQEAKNIKGVQSIEYDIVFTCHHLMKQSSDKKNFDAIINESVEKWRARNAEREEKRKQACRNFGLFGAVLGAAIATAASAAIILSKICP